MVPLETDQARQFDEIAAWKSERASLVMAAFRRVAAPFLLSLARAVPDKTLLCWPCRPKRFPSRRRSTGNPPRAAPKDLGGSHSWSLAECDALAAATSAVAERRAPARRCRRRDRRHRHRDVERAGPPGLGPAVDRAGRARATASPSMPRTTGGSSWPSSSSRRPTPPRVARRSAGSSATWVRTRPLPLRAALPSPWTGWNRSCSRTWPSAPCPCSATSPGSP